MRYSLDLVVIIIATTLPFLLHLNGDFVFDDSEAILKNKDVHGDDWFNTFTNDFWGSDIQSNVSHKSYRPLTTISFRLNYLLSGYQLVAHHFKITNLLLHSVCCTLVWISFQILLNDNHPHKECEKFWKSKANLASLLFSIHPVHVESVSGIVGRADILAGVSFFLAFIMYDKAVISLSKLSQSVYILMTVTLSGISMLCKENGITILGFCIIYEFSNFVFRRKNQNNISLTSCIVRVFILLIAALGMLYVRWTVMGGTRPQFNPIDNPAAFADSIFTKVLSYNYIYFLNIMLLIWPHWLCYDWSMGCVPLIKGFDGRIMLVALMYVYGGFILKVLMSGKTMASTRRQILLAVSLIVVPFLPAANIFYPVGFVIAERILYIPSAGFCLLVVIGLKKIIDRRRWRKVGLFLYGVLLLIFLLKSWHRSSKWMTEYSLFTSALSVCPLNAKVHYNIAKAADARQQSAWALEEYKEAIRLYPEYYQAMNNLANLLKNQKKYLEAESYLRKAIRHKDDFPPAWMNLGIVLANTKKYDESRDAYRMALKYRNNYPDCYYNLGNLNLEMNNTKKAMDNWFEAIRLSPKHNLAWTNLLALLDNTEQVDKAMEVIPKALAQLPDSSSVNFAIANIYGKMERYQDAEKYFLRAIQLFGENVQPIHYSNLGVLYHRWKKYKLAQKMYENALKIDPNFRSALQNLKSVQRSIK